MAAIYITDSLGNATRYALPNAQGETLLIGTEEGCHVLLPAAEGLAARHAGVEWNGTDYVLSDYSGNGGIVVNGQAEASVLLVAGVAYFVGPYTLAYDPEMVQDEVPAPTEAPAATAAPRLTKAALPDQPVRMRRSVNVAPLDIPAPRQENVLVTLMTPIYVTAVLVAAFIAGLTLRYWLISGSFFPSDFLK